MSDYTTNDPTKKTRKPSTRKYTHRPIEERFWAKVNKTDTCWLWTGAVRRFGYGVINSGRKSEAAHRVSWTLHYGPIPDGMCVLHQCDVPACVNPDHLFLGTYADNNRDMKEKGRARGGGQQGEKCNKAKLTAQQVIEIRNKYAESSPLLRELSVQYGVGLDVIQAIVHGDIWKSVGGPICTANKTKGENNNMAKLITAQVLAIRAEYAAGNTDRTEIGNRYGVSHMAIYCIVKRHTWKHI